MGLMPTLDKCCDRLWEVERIRTPYAVTGFLLVYHDPFFIPYLLRSTIFINMNIP